MPTNFPSIKKLKPLFVFIVAGPPLGALPLALLFLVHDVLEKQEFSGMVFLILLFAYPFGICPAAIAGLIYLWMLPRMQQNQKQFSAFYHFSVGACCGLIGSLLFLLLIHSDALEDFEWSESWVMIVGSIAGGCCALLIKPKQMSSEST